MKIDKVTILLVVMVGLVCVLRGATLYYWWHTPGIELPSIPAIIKGVQFPFVSIATLLIGLPCIAILALPILRTLQKVLFISGAMVSFGIVSIMASIYLSFNVAGGGAIFILLGMYLYRSASNCIRVKSNA